MALREEFLELVQEPELGRQFGGSGTAYREGNLGLDMKYSSILSITNHYSPSVDTKDPAIYQSCQVKIIKNLDTVLPGISISILSHAFLIETVHLGNLSRFVIASK